jgi:hypothetical protein
MIAAASGPETGGLQAQNPAYRLARHFSKTHEQSWRDCATTVTRFLLASGD